MSLANQDQWPEEEASLTFSTYNSIVEDDGKAGADEWLVKQRAYMHEVFDDEVDAARYDRQLDSLLNPLWN